MMSYRPLRLGLVTLVTAMLTTGAMAHSGRTNSQGCHHNRKTGGYHCHSGGSASSLFKRDLKDHRIIAIDGDTIRAGNSIIRLYGIDAPEEDQLCDVEGKTWKCGSDAKISLSLVFAFTDVDELRCSQVDEDSDGTIIAKCYDKGNDVSSYLVREGMAVAFTDHSTEYIEDVDFARKNKRGLWKSTFEMPWEYRDERQDE